MLSHIWENRSIERSTEPTNSNKRKRVHNNIKQTYREQNNIKQTNWVKNYVSTYLGCSSRSRFKIILTGSICADMQLCKVYEDFTEVYEYELQAVQSCEAPFLLQTDCVLLFWRFWKRKVWTGHRTQNMWWSWSRWLIVRGRRVNLIWLDSSPRFILDFVDADSKLIPE